MQVVLLAKFSTCEAKRFYKQCTFLEDLGLQDRGATMMMMDALNARDATFVYSCLTTKQQTGARLHWPQDCDLCLLC